MIRVVLVDDEPPARRKIRHLLSTQAEFAVVGEAGSGAEAIELINQLRPELVFVDIQLPDCTGFEIIESVPEREKIRFVFVTAHDDFALKAFDVHAADYLLKPVEPSRFAQALQKIRQGMEDHGTLQLSSKLDELVDTLRRNPAYVRRLLIQQGERSIFLDVSRIDWIEAARNYACIYSGEQTYTLRSSLDAIAAKLDPKKFRRINRSEVVNLDRIAELQTWFHGDQKVLLKSGKELNWSRRYRVGATEELEQG